MWSATIQAFGRALATAPQGQLQPIAPADALQKETTKHLDATQQTSSPRTSVYLVTNPWTGYGLNPGICTTLIGAEDGHNTHGTLPSSQSVTRCPSAQTIQHISMSNITITDTKQPDPLSSPPTAPLCALMHGDYCFIPTKKLRAQTPGSKFNIPFTRAPALKELLTGLIVYEF